ncbi:hypothetical protein EDD21DRAFT_364469 [Dissophora ornata]|nr:hypothetical protein EDD21DRAFT_364469 [Dissophora ornata]
MDFTIPRSSASILLVGHAGIGKRRLASYIRSEITPQIVASRPIHNSESIAAVAKGTASKTSNTDVTFRTAETVPLQIPPPNTGIPTLTLFRDFNTESSSKKPSTITGTVVDSIARYDLILFMVNMTNKASWNECKAALLQLDPGWFLGRCAIVVTRVAVVSKYAFDRDDISNFVDIFYDIPIAWTNLEVDSEAALTALQIVRLLEIGAGYRRRGGNSSLASLSRTSPATAAAALAATSFTGGATVRPKTPAGMAASLSSLSSGAYVGSNLGSRMTSTYLMTKSPEKYNLQETTLPDEEVLSSAVAELYGGQ